MQKTIIILLSFFFLIASCAKEEISNIEVIKEKQIDLQIHNFLVFGYRSS